MTAKMTQQMGNHGLVLVKKPAVSVSADMRVLREGSTGQVVTMLPRVWAVGTPEAVPEPDRTETQPGPRLVAAPEQPGSRPKVELAFYRKYTEALLRRYLRLSTAAGRVPSLLGRELFQGNVTSYRGHSFEDAVVFCMDVEKCLEDLSGGQKALLRRIALQEYTHAEAAAVLGLGTRATTRHYWRTLDRLTEMFLQAGMLEGLKSCQ